MAGSPLSAQDSLILLAIQTEPISIQTENFRRLITPCILQLYRKSNKAYFRKIQGRSNLLEFGTTVIEDIKFYENFLRTHALKEQQNPLLSH